MAPSKVSFSSMRSAVFFGLIIALSVAIIYLIAPFLYPLFWAAIIAVVFYPMFARITRHLKTRGLSAVITMLIVILVIFVPLTALSAMLVNESVRLYTTVSKTGVFSNVGGNVQGVSSFLERTSLAPIIENIKTEWTSYAAEFTKRLSSLLFTTIKNVTQNSVRFIFMLFIMFYSLYYFLKDGERMLNKLMHLSPLGDTYEQMLFQKFTSTVRATLKGTFIVGGVQGALGGILFWITGIQGALVWGVLMMATSIVPAVGSFVVWLPAGVIMLALGNLWQGLTILIVGALIISTIDNFLRPPIVGKDTQMHPMMILFTTLGGIFLFGISGFVIGPIIAALYMAMISIYDHYYKSELKHN